MNGHRSPARRDAAPFPGVFLAALLAAALATPLPPARALQDPPAAEPAAPAAPTEPAEPAEPEAPALLPVPRPELTGLEPEVAEQLTGIREELERYFARPEADPAARAEAYGELGRLYHAYGFFQPSEAAYANAHQLAPAEHRWAYLLAYLYQQHGHFEHAAELYGRALGNEETLPALVHLAEVYIALERLDDAETVLRRALSWVPELPSARALLGQIALSRQEYRLAADYLESALAAVPQATRLHYPLALAYRGLGDLAKAQEHLALRGEIGLRPPDPLVEELEELKEGKRVRIFRGRMAFRAGDFEAAAREFRQAVAAQPDSVAARVNLGSALGQLGDRIGAIHQFRRTLELAPDNAAAHFNLGVLLGLEGAREPAAEHLSKAAALEPGDGEVQRELARALLWIGRPAEALESYRRASGLAPFDVDTRLEEVQLLVDLRRFEEAGVRLDETHGLLPRSPRVVNALARWLSGAPDPALRDGERAAALASALVEAEPTADHAETLAMALAEAGRCDEAAQWQRRVVDAHREAGETGRLGELEAVLGRYAAGPPCRYPTGSPEEETSPEEIN